MKNKKIQNEIAKYDNINYINRMKIKNIKIECLCIQ